MKFSKMLLASAIALSSSAFAMESMSDDSLSDTTGQDGLTIGLTTSALSFGMNIYDTDSFAAVAPVVAADVADVGVITMGATANKVRLNTAGNPITLTIDAGSAAAGATPILNIGVAIPTGTVIHTGDLGVAGTATAKGVAAKGVFGAVVNNVTILNDMTITLGATTLNLQLGNAPQGAMVNVNTSMTGGGLNIANFALNDASLSGGGAIFASSIQVVNTGTAIASLPTATLGVVATASVKSTGLVIGLTTLGTASGMDVYMKSVGVGVSGTTPVIGDISLIGLNLSGSTVTIAGH